MVKKKKGVVKKAVSTVGEGLAIAGLIINIIVIPSGIGSILGGRVYSGIWQIVLSILGIVLASLGILFTLTVIGAIIGIPLVMIGGSMFIAAWIWGFITGIRMVS